MREAAAVVADVEDDGFLVEVVGVEGADEAVQARPRPCSGCGCSRACPCSARRRARRSCRPSARTSGRRSAPRLTRLRSRRGACCAGRPGCAVTVQRDGLADLVVEQLWPGRSCRSSSAPSMARMTSPALRSRPRWSAGPRLRISAIFRPGPVVGASKSRPRSAVVCSGLPRCREMPRCEAFSSPSIRLTARTGLPSGRSA